MPYIIQQRRKALNRSIKPLAISVETDGDLNYAITSLVVAFIKKNGISYSVLARVIGTLTLVTHELQRRLIAPYEDHKIVENGDIEGYYNSTK